MSISPTENSGGVVRFAIQTNGNAIPFAMQVLAVRVYKAVNKVPRAEVVLRDDAPANGGFPSSEGDTFKPGATITIAITVGYADTMIFSGIVVGQKLTIGSDNLSTVTVECRDKAVALTIGRKNANYVNKTDSDIATQLIGAVSGLKAKVTTTATKWKEMVQYYSTDWDFLLARAEANGFVVIVNDGEISFAEPDTAATATLKVTYGVDLLEFHADLDACDQFSSVEAAAWDIGNLKVMTAKATPSSLNKQGDLGAADLAKVLGVGAFGLQTSVTMEQSALTAWAKAQQVKSGLARVRGSMKFQGAASAKVGGIIDLAGVGKRFNGAVYVSAVTHDICDGNWTTQADFGMSPAWHAESGDLKAPSAAGLLPGIEGLHIGVVKKLDADPDGQFKIQVSIPFMRAETDGVWARLMQFHGTSGQGAFFVPEIGDEVVLGYFNNDPSAPVILGSLYSNKRKPRYAVAADNPIKAISTRSGLALEYDDKKNIITLVTPGGNKIVISDDGKSVLLQDQNDNKLKLDASGISLDSQKDITLKAQGNISLIATGNVKIKATGDATMEGRDVSLTAQVGLTGKGGVTAEPSSPVRQPS